MSITNLVKIVLSFWLFFFCFCASHQEASAPKRIVVGLEASPSVLDPRLARDAYAMQILPLVFPGLFEIGKNLSAQPNLLLDYTQLTETSYLFKLKPNLKFANGKELSSIDVKATLESLTLPEIHSPYAELGNRIKRIEIIDPYSFKLELTEPFAPILVQLCIGILPAELALKNSPLQTQELIGAGPFKIQNFEPGSRLVLVPNPFYPGPKPFFEKIEFRILPEDTTRILSLEKGEVQLLQNPIPIDEFPHLKNHPRLKVMERPGINYTYLGFNFQDPVLSDFRVRQAIAFAINREQLIKCLLKGTVVEANSMLSPRHWAYESAVPVYNYAPELAKKLLDQAGYPDPDGDGPKPRFKLVYKTSQNQQRIWVAQAIAYQLSQIGIEVEVRSLEWGTLFADIQAGNFQIYALTWVGVIEPDLYYTIFHSASIPPQGANRGRYQNPELDHLLEQARRTMAQEERKILYSQIQKIVAQDLAYISLWYSNDIAVSDHRLLGFELGPGGEWTGLATARWQE